MQTQFSNSYRSQIEKLKATLPKENKETEKAFFQKVHNNHGIERGQQVCKEILEKEPGFIIIPPEFDVNETYVIFENLQKDIKATELYPSQSSFRFQSKETLHSLVLLAHLYSHQC